MPAMTDVICGNKKCRKTFQARTADVARGWGRFCSKSCKAHKQGRLLASKETQKMWRDYNRETVTRKHECKDCGTTSDVGGDGYCTLCAYHNEPQQGWDDHKSY